MSSSMSCWIINSGETAYDQYGPIFLYMDEFNPTERTRLGEGSHFTRKDQGLTDTIPTKSFFLLTNISASLLIALSLSTHLIEFCRTKLQGRLSGLGCGYEDRGLYLLGSSSLFINAYPKPMNKDLTQDRP